MESPGTSFSSTAERLLDAGERLFGTKGLDGCSIRELAKAAGANLAAPHYHFGSKERLYAEVFLRRVRPLNEERLLLLRAAEALPAGPAKLEAVVASFVAPTLRMGRRHPAFLALLGRNLTSPPAFMAEVMTREFAPLVQAYRPTLQSLLPDLPPAELFWRMNFLVGALIYTTAHFPTIERLAEGLGGGDAVELMARRLVLFTVAGLRAPHPTPP